MLPQPSLRADTSGTLFLTLRPRILRGVTYSRGPRIGLRSPDRVEDHPDPRRPGQLGPRSLVRRQRLPIARRRPAVLDREQQQAAANEECRRSEDSSLRPATDYLAKPIFLEAIGKDLLAAAGATIDKHGDRLAPLHVLEFAGAIAISDLHRRRSRVEQVKILGDRAAPAIAQVPDQRVGVVQRTLRKKTLERPLIGRASVAPDMNIADASAVGPYYTGTSLQAVQEHFVGLNIDRCNRYLHKRAGTTQTQHDFLVNLTTE